MVLGTSHSMFMFTKHMILVNKCVSSVHVLENVDLLDVCKQNVYFVEVSSEKLPYVTLSRKLPQGLSFLKKNKISGFLGHAHLGNMCIYHSE